MVMSVDATERLLKKLGDGEGPCIDDLQITVAGYRRRTEDTLNTAWSHWCELLVSSEGSAECALMSQVLVSVLTNLPHTCPSD